MVNGGTGEIDIGGYGHGHEIGGPPRFLIPGYLIEAVSINHTFDPMTPVSCMGRRTTWLSCRSPAVTVP
jgi:hypothetical protein